MCTNLKANIPSLAVFDNLWYVETTAKLQPSSDTQTQSITVCPIQTHLFQLPVLGCKPVEIQKNQDEHGADQEYNGII